MSLESGMWIIAGLGNPGVKYDFTRHNLGFLVLEKLLDDLLPHGSSWKEQSKAQVSKGSLFDTEVLLVKPFTFMNLSGEPLRSIMDFYKVDKGKLLVIHDEIDLPFASMKLKLGGGDGGHNGLKSIFDHCGGRDFLRLRMGVGKPEHPSFENLSFDKSNWVLGGFSQEEKSSLASFIERGIEAVKAVLSKDLASAQQFINT